MNHSVFTTISVAFLTLMGISGCQKQGCTDYSACNYESDADEDDGSCYYNCGGGSGNNCNYTNWAGTANCANSGYYPVYTGKCCSSSYPYYNTASNMCYTSCSSAEGANTLGSVYRINDGSGAGGGGGTGGGGSCPSMGRFAVKIYNDPKTGGCPGNSINHTLRFYYCCAHGQSSNSVAAGIWSYGQDAGGSYMTCIFGDETAMLCVHGTTLYKRVYRFEWEVTPKTVSSYPNTCILSGATNIDYQDQLKSVVIDWL